MGWFGQVAHCGMNGWAIAGMYGAAVATGAQGEYGAAQGEYGAHGGAQVAANRLRDAVAGHSFFNSEGNEPIKLTGSIGIAYWQPVPGPGGTWEPQLIALAERALRAAKLSGPNRLVMLQAA